MEGRPLSPRLEPKVESAPVMIISNQDVRNGWPATRKNGIVPGKGIWETGPKRPSGTLILICPLGRNHAVRTQLVRVAAEKALPFDVKIPTPGLRTRTRRHRWVGSRPCAPTLWFSGCLAPTEGGAQADLTWREEAESRCSCPQGSARIPAPYPWSRRSRSRRSPRDRARRRFSCRRNLIRVQCRTHDPQAELELPWDALVEENPHPSWPTRTHLASSNAEMAASRVTVGKSSMNSSRFCPPSR